MMHRLMIRALATLLTFTIGLASGKLWLVCNRLATQPVIVKIRKAHAPKLASQSITFEDTGLQDMFLDWYLSSDGVNVRYGCSDRGSASYATLLLSGKGPQTRVLEHTPKLNAKGSRVGERVVTVTTIGTYRDAHIEWTEGARLFYIQALSLKYARAFEQSKAWAGQGCMDMRVFDLQRLKEFNQWRSRTSHSSGRLDR